MVLAGRFLFEALEQLLVVAKLQIHPISLHRIFRALNSSLLFQTWSYMLEESKFFIRFFLFFILSGVCLLLFERTSDLLWHFFFMSRIAVFILVKLFRSSDRNKTRNEPGIFSFIFAVFSFFNLLSQESVLFLNCINIILVVFQSCLHALKPQCILFILCSDFFVLPNWLSVFLWQLLQLQK